MSVRAPNQSGWRLQAALNTIRTAITGAELYGAAKATAGSKRKKPSSAGKGTKRYKKATVGKVTVADSGATKKLYRKKAAPKRKKSLRSRVATLEKYKPKQATKEYRNVDAQNIICTANNCVYENFNGLTSSILESASTDVQFIDRGATPAPDSINLTDQTYQHKMDFRNLYTHIRFKNNNEMTAVLDVYCMICTDASGNPPLTWMTSQDSNFGVTDIDTNINCYPSDSSELLKHWKIEKHTKAVLGAGDTLDCYYSRKRRLYDPKAKDTSGVTYQPGDQVWFMRLQGDVVHGSNDATIGYGNPTVDYVVKRKVTLYYTAETPFHKIESVNSLDAMTSPEEAGPAIDPALTDQ
jgi:hypothetical protein